MCIPEADKPQRPGPRIETRHVEALERLIDALSEQLPPLENFILPGGTAVAAQLHVARTVCRRAERLAVDLASQEPLGTCVVPYLNRLSDALFVMARFHNKLTGAASSGSFCSRKIRAMLKSAVGSFRSSSLTLRKAFWASP